MTRYSAVGAPRPQGRSRHSPPTQRTDKRSVVRGDGGDIVHVVREHEVAVPVIAVNAKRNGRRPLGPWANGATSLTPFVVAVSDGLAEAGEFMKSFILLVGRSGCGGELAALLATRS